MKALLLSLALTGALGYSADRASFQLEATSPQPYTSAYLGNGALGVETSALGTLPTHSFLSGLYDQTPGDVPRIAAAPAWNEIDVSNGARWLNSESAAPHLDNYRQTLDMYDGVLQTSYTWSADHKNIRLQVDEFVSRDRPDSAALRLSLTPDFSGDLKVRLPLRNWLPPHRYLLARLAKLDYAAAHDPWLVWYPGYLRLLNAQAQNTPHSAVLSLLAQTPGASAQLAEAVALTWSSAATVSTHKDDRGSSAELNIAAQSGHTYTFTKYAALITSPASTNLEQSARETAARDLHTGWDTLLAQHTAAWHRLWESDILVDGNPSLQKIVHSMLFYLLGSARAHSDVSLPPMGLSTAGYYGHIFWDAETFMYPALLLLHPDLARPVVAFRSRTRDIARRNAQQNGFKGAMYPWEADPAGRESTPLFAGQNAKYENHINGDIALAAWQYWLATGDRNWLEHDCWPILRDTADFWVSRVTYNSQARRYEIGKVVAVNESLIGVSNDAYTNAVAHKNLALAGLAAAAVHQPPHPQWEKVARALYLPESDSALLWFPLDRAFPTAKTRQAIDSMLAAIHKGDSGTMMGSEFYPILAAQLGDRRLIGQLLDPLSKAYLRPPFQVVAETPTNQNTNFLTGAGAFLQQLVFGYPGLRLTEDGLKQKFPATLPPGVSKLTLQNITVHGTRRTLVFTSRQ